MIEKWQTLDFVRVSRTRDELFEYKLKFSSSSSPGTLGTTRMMRVEREAAASSTPLHVVVIIIIMAWLPDCDKANYYIFIKHTNAT